MKYIMIILLLLGSVQRMQAQTFAEWFQQAKTQKKYLAEQIAALQFYIGIAKEGYKTVGSGLQTIGDIKNGDFDIHSLYLTGLKSVSPAIAAYPRSKDILLLQQSTLNTVIKSKRQAANSDAFSPEQLAYIQTVYQRLTSDCDQTITELEAVTTPGRLEMKDDERIQRIDKLHRDAQGQYRFAKQFADGLAVLAVQKDRDGRELKNQNTLYHIK